MYYNSMSQQISVHKLHNFSLVDMYKLYSTKVAVCKNPVKKCTITVPFFQNVDNPYCSSSHHPR